MQLGWSNQSDVGAATAAQTTAVCRGVSNGDKEISEKDQFVLMLHQVIGRRVATTGPRDWWMAGRSQAGNNASSEGWRRLDAAFANVRAEPSHT